MSRLSDGMGEAISRPTNILDLASTDSSSLRGRNNHCFPKRYSSFRSNPEYSRRYEGKRNSWGYTPIQRKDIFGDPIRVPPPIQENHQFSAFQTRDNWNQMGYEPDLSWTDSSSQYGFL